MRPCPHPLLPLHSHKGIWNAHVVPTQSDAGTVSGQVGWGTAAGWGGTVAVWHSPHRAGATSVGLVLPAHVARSSAYGNLGLSLPAWAHTWHHQHPWQHAKAPRSDYKLGSKANTLPSARTLTLWCHQGWSWGKTAHWGGHTGAIETGNPWGDVAQGRDALGSLHRGQLCQGCLRRPSPWFCHTDGSLHSRQEVDSQWAPSWVDAWVPVPLSCVSGGAGAGVLW